MGKREPIASETIAEQGGDPVKGPAVPAPDGADSLKDAVLITGATGFLGTQVTRLLLGQTVRPILVLVRGREFGEARNRLERVWWDWPELIREIGGRIEVIAGDLCLPQFGLDTASYRGIAEKVRTILHLAADIRLDAPQEELHVSNVSSVRNVLELADHIHRIHGLNRFSYVSTAYVAGGRKGVVPEDELTDRYGFSNNYERSKYEGESLVREAGKVLPVTIFRPGMVIGDSRTGAVRTFNTLYFPLRLYLTGKLKFLPVDPAMKINLVPCDYVAEAISRLTFEPKAKGITFHLTLPQEALPTVREMIQITREWAAERLHVRLPAPVYLPFPVSSLKWLDRFFPGNSTVRSLLSLASYFEEARVYQRDNLDQLFGKYRGSWRDFFPQILTYAAEHGFMHRTERTVHEQAYFRLSGKSRPITFHDVVPGETITRNADEVRCEIDRIVSSLRKMGMRAGDRIAVTGFNSSRYFAIDVAIGLCGGISVPLYYSSPIGELREILQDSGARMIFVGVPDILKKLGEAGLNIPVVSFCRETPQCKLPEGFLEWQSFLMLGENTEKYREAAGTGQPGKSPAGFGEIATLRYTSGTTGRPKGAAFDHAGLRSMAESLASLPPWKARVQKVVYLSFLPMNHVVEGILATYAISFTPATIDLYYLENFQELQDALPKVRPTVFFSVPRFYEKVWENAAKSLIGRLFIRREDGAGKRILGRILRLGVSKKAGIDRCLQLIVGSAPVSTGLLEHYGSIGIEVHNAYGLTEAPLITLNRHMANQIGTVGEPLPETQIRIADDGEVLVKGPQIMKGYYRGGLGSEIRLDESNSPFVDGWLRTGDFGELTDDGHLVLNGRKKEVIINSYGKNINPVKIELMLREVTGINHVMLYGEGKPYCVALLWGCPDDDPAAAAAIGEGIEMVNQQLPHPEQVRKWALLMDELTIAGGELTANLKMKREFIAAKYAKVIDDLYTSK